MGALRLAVLGLNYGSKIAYYAKKNAEVDLVALAGYGDQEMRIASDLEVPIYSDYTLLLKQVSLDAAYIALPNDLHLEAVENAIRAGIKNILLESPIANTVEDGKRIAELCQEAGVNLLVGHQRRFSTKHQMLHEVVTSGCLGEIIALQACYCVAKDPICFAQDWHVEKGVGGPLLINAIHDFDDLNYVVAKTPVKVYAVAHNATRGNEAEDSASILIEYENGVTATYTICDGTPSPWNYDLAAGENRKLGMISGKNSLQIFGTKGTFGFPNMDLYYYDDNALGWAEEIKHKSFNVETNFPLKSELEHFIDLCLDRESVPQCKGEEGLRSLEIANGVLESSETGKAVYLMKYKL